MGSVGELLEQSRVLDLGPLPAPRLAPNVTIHQALPFLVRGRRGALVVVEDLQPVGILTERDVLRRLPEGWFTSRERRVGTAVREIMSRPPVTVRGRASLTEALETMDRLHHRHLVVVGRDGKLKGLLTTNDIVQFLTDKFPEHTVNLPPRLRQHYPSTEGA